MRFSRLPLAAAFLLALLGLAACGEPPKAVQATPAPLAPPSLYQRLGEKPGITAVVDDFVGNVAADRRINQYFKRTKLPNFKMLLVEQLCAGTGGPCQYSGRSMKDAHEGMKINEAAFAALVEDLQKSLNKFKVPAQEQNDLLAILGPMKADIVTAPKASPIVKATTKPTTKPVAKPARAPVVKAPEKK